GYRVCEAKRESSSNAPRCFASSDRRSRGGCERISGSRSALENERRPSEARGPVPRPKPLACSGRRSKYQKKVPIGRGVTRSSSSFTVSSTVSASSPLGFRTGFFGSGVSSMRVDFLGFFSTGSPCNLLLVGGNQEADQDGD